jgi:hypothetical protein
MLRLIGVWLGMIGSLLLLLLEPLGGVLARVVLGVSVVFVEYMAVMVVVNPDDHGLKQIPLRVIPPTQRICTTITKV